MTDARHARLTELLAEELTRALTSEETRELEALLAEELEISRDDFALAAASVERVLSPVDEAPAELPTELEARLFDQAVGFFAAAGEPAESSAAARESTGLAPIPLRAAKAPEKRGGKVLLYSGWGVAAAASFALLVQMEQVAERVAEKPVKPEPAESTVVVSAPAPEPPVPTALAERSLLLEGSETIQWSWAHTQDPLSEAVSGDVVWNAHAQAGFLHLRGLKRNDPAHEQYQLWIFDAKRNEAHPVDGGVFDSTGEDLVIRIDPRVPVHEATLFAITVEPPGGVVVSDRKRLVVVAAQPG